MSRPDKDVRAAAFLLLDACWIHQPADSSPFRPSPRPRRNRKARPAGVVLEVDVTAGRWARQKLLASPFHSSAPLPPYCPKENKIEWVWLDVHANVTRNHRCPDMEQLMRQVVAYPVRRNRHKKTASARPATAV